MTQQQRQQPVSDLMGGDWLSHLSTQLDTIDLGAAPLQPEPQQKVRPKVTRKAQWVPAAARTRQCTLSQ